nr:MAG TPA: Nuclease [Caudoviricetes sp.]
MLESEIEKKLVREVRKMGGMAYKFVSPGNTGVPDRIVILPGVITFVELKTETGRLSPGQKRQIGKLQDLGMKVVVLHGMKELEEFLDEIRPASVSADSLQLDYGA